MINEVWNILCELAPWLLAGTVLSGCLHVWLPADFARRKLAGKGGVLRSVIFGVPLPLCSCGVVPAGIGLKKDGASDGASIAFLISTPQTGIDSMLVSASAFGWPFAIFKVITAAVTGLVGGVITDAVNPNQPLAEEFRTNSLHEKKRSWKQFWSHGNEVLHSIWIWLLLGIFISAAITRYVPHSFFESIGSLGVGPASFFALLVSLPLYVCATASIPIAAALVANGLPAGAALVFLIAGPATNVATIGAIFGRFGLKTTCVYLLTIIVGSFVAAYIFELFDSSQLVALANPHLHQTWWHQLSAWILICLLVRFAFIDFRRLVSKWHNKKTAAGNMQVAISGMTCGNCANQLETALKKADGIESATVTLNPDQAIVSGAISAAQLREIVEANGFEVCNQSSSSPTQARY